MSARVSTTREFTPLPDALRQTQGPHPGTDDATCPICREEMPSDAATIEHPECGRRFDDRCLRQWLESSPAPTCPLCQACLTTAGFMGARLERYLQSTGEDRMTFIDRFVRMSIEEATEVIRDARVNDIVVARQQWQSPTVFHIASSLCNACAIFQSAAPAMTSSALAQSLGHQSVATQHVIQRRGVNTPDIPIAKTTDLIRRSGEFMLDPASFENLWLASRLFGVTHWVLSQIDEVPDVGVWLPLLPDFGVMDVQEAKEIFFDDRSGFFTTLTPQAASSVMCGAAIPSSILLNLIRRFYLMNLEHSMADLELIRIWRLTIVEEIKHFSLYLANSEQALHPDFVPGRLYVVPWPQSAYPSSQAAPTLTPTETRLWHAAVDKAMFEAVLQSELAPALELSELPPNLRAWPQARLLAEPLTD